MHNVQVGVVCTPIQSASYHTPSLLNAMPCGLRVEQLLVRARSILHFIAEYYLLVRACNIYEPNPSIIIGINTTR